jgi:CBS-domain-containing membrane protein
MTIATVLKEKGAYIVSVAPDATLEEVAHVIATRRIGAVVVLDDHRRLVGIVSERDLVKGLSQKGAKLLEMKAADIMTRDVSVVDPTTPVNVAMEIMDHGYFRHLPVCSREGELLGLVSIRDLVKYRMMQDKHDFESMKAYVFRVGNG